MKNNCLFTFITLWWSACITVHGEHVLFLNLLKDEESPEDFKSGIDFIPTFNFHDNMEKNISQSGHEISNNSEPTEIKKEQTEFQLSHLLDELTLSTLKKDSYSGTTKNTEVFEENPDKTRKTGNLHFLNKKTTEQSTSKNYDTLLPVRSEEGGFFSFINLCFDMIASLIQGVMKGLMSVGDAESNPNPSEIPNDYSQNPSRIRKRDISASDTVLKATKPLQVNASLNFGVSSISSADVKETSDLQEQTNKSSSLEPLNIVNENVAAALKKNDKDVNKSLLTDAKDVNEHNKLNLEENANKDQVVTDTSTLMRSLPTETTETISLKVLATALDELTEEENSNALFMNDIFNKQNDLLLPEVLKGQLATARFFPQPHEGEHSLEQESKTGTVLIATGALLAILVVASVGIAAAYKLQLFNIRRGRSGNRNSPSQRNAMA